MTDSVEKVDTATEEDLRRIFTKYRTLKDRSCMDTYRRGHT
jgi:hypothetical protein